MPAFGDVNTPADQLIWRQLIEKEKSSLRSGPRGGFSLRAAVSREDVPIKFKPGHLDPSKDKPSTKGFDPKAYGWDPQGELATEFKRVRKSATADGNQRFLFPLTTAQETGWCLKVPRQRRDKSLRLPPADSKADSKPPLGNADGLDKPAKAEGESRQRRMRRKEGQETNSSLEEGEPKRELRKRASESQLSAAPPTDLSAAAPSYVSSAMITELSRATSWPGVSKELVDRVRVQDARVAKAMVEYNRYLCTGDRGLKHHYPLGETDATAYANAFILATSGVPPHKWDPRAGPAGPAASE